MTDVASLADVVSRKYSAVFYGWATKGETRMSQQFAVEEEAAVVAWACRQCSQEFETLRSTHIIVRLIGLVDGGETQELAFKVELLRARQIVKLSAPFSMSDLGKIAAALTPQFVEAPIIIIHTCDADEDITP
jgi:hypothetical protein